MYGLNKRREAYIFTGTGANGKSLITDSLIKRAFGDYYKSIKAKYFTSTNHQSSQASPEMADKQYCRILVASEPEADEQLQVAKIKNITGLEDIQCRALYQAEKEFKPQFTPIILCNDIPAFTKIDKAICDRIKIKTFDNKFVLDPQKPNERLKDLNLDQTLDTLEIRQAFIYILIEHYKNVELKQSKLSVIATEKFLGEQNPIFNFLRECIVRVNGENIQSKDMYAYYNNYCLSNNIKSISNIAFGRLMKFNEFTTDILGANKTYYLDCKYAEQY